MSIKLATDEIVKTHIDGSTTIASNADAFVAIINLTATEVGKEAEEPIRPQPSS